MSSRWFCVLLLPVLLGLWGFSGHPVAVPVSRESAELIAPDVLAQPRRPVLLAARLVTTRLFMQTGLGGEPVDFLVEGTSIGHTITGGDGWARKEFVPKKHGVFELTVRLASGRRVKAQSRTVIVASVQRTRPIVLVDLEAAMTQIDKPMLGPFDFSAFGQPRGGLPKPIPGAADALAIVSKRAALLYLLVGRASRSPDVHSWLVEHGLPSGPVFMLEPGARALASRIERWKDDGWTNMQAGIGRNVEVIDKYVEQELHAVMVGEAYDEDDIPQGVTVVSEWKDLATVKAVTFE